MERTIQFKRSKNIALTQSEAKEKISKINLENGEIAIGTYENENSVNGSIATMVALKGNDKLFYVDNQVILDTIGIHDDGTVNENITGNSIVNQIKNETERAENAESLLQQSIDELAISGSEISSDVTVLSSKTITSSDDTSTIDLTVQGATDGTRKIKADVKLSDQQGNVIQRKNDGIYTKVDYNAVRNVLIVNEEEKPLSPGSVVDSIEYDTETENLIIKYHTTSSPEELTVKVNMKDLIEEYSFDEDGSVNNNVKFTTTRNVSGKTIVKANIENYNCGTF